MVRNGFWHTDCIVYSLLVMKNALKTDLKRFIDWAAGSIIIAIGSGSFRSEVSSVTQTAMRIGADRARLSEFEYIEQVLKTNTSREGQREVLNYIDRKRISIAKEWDFEF